MPDRQERYPRLLRADDVLLAVVDMQGPFLRHIWQRDRVLSRVCTLIEAAQILDIPIVATLQNEAKMGGVVTEVAERLPTGCLPLDKLTFSCIADRACAAAIAGSRRQILLCGVETHICIAQTAHDLVSGGYEVHIAADAVSSRTQEDRETALRRMGHAGVILSSVEAALYEMLQTAAHPRFRDVLRLVK